MIFKNLNMRSHIFMKLRSNFAQLPKKRTEAPKFKPKQNDRIDPKKVDYNLVPPQLRKGVKAYVQATNMLVTSQAELQAISLKEVILQERAKFLQNLQKTGQVEAKPKEQSSDKSLSKQGETKQVQKQIAKQEKHYDFLAALKYMSNVSNFLMINNIAGYMLFHSLKKYSYLGFFLGVSMNPSIIALTGLSIGFNCASWIIRQSLHLQIKNPQQLTVDRISLTGSNYLMSFEALMIACQAFGLSYYLMTPNPFQNINFLISAFIISQGHTIFNMIRATGGYKFELFSKLLLTQMISIFLIGCLAYSLFGKIAQFQESVEYSKISNPDGIETGDENFLLKRGYERFLSEFKTKDFSMFFGQKINQITSESQ